jgi:hypothetical protein
VGTAAGAAAIAADMITRPGLVLASDGMPILMGKLNSESSATTLQNGTSGVNALSVRSSGATALQGSDPTGVGVAGSGGSEGVRGTASAGAGVKGDGSSNGVEGTTGNAGGSGIAGNNTGGGFGVRGTTNEGAGNAFVPGSYGANTNPSGTYGTGVVGRSLSQRGNGVIGIAHTGTDAFGTAGLSNQGVGAWGQGGAIGVQGIGTAGPGVQGQGTTNGVEGATVNANASGVSGNNTGGGYGVSGATNEAGGRWWVPGVYGTNNNPAGSFGSGVYGRSSSPHGNGVIGIAHTGTDAWGVAGQSSQGVGVNAQGGTAGVQATSTGGPGVQGLGATNGVEGTSNNATGSGVTGSNGGAGYGVSGTTNEGGGKWWVPGVYGTNDNPAGSFGSGVYGRSLSQHGNGVIGIAHTGTDAWGVAGQSSQGVGVNAQGGTAGVQASSGGGPGVQGLGATNGVEGTTANTTGSGVVGSNTGGGYGVTGISNQDASAFVPGVYGTNNNPTGSYGTGIYGRSLSPHGNGVIGLADTETDAWGLAGFSRDGVGVHAQGGRLAGEFIGDVSVSGTLSKGAGSFRIDHPLDPANKYLSHSFVESPEMLNVYNGTAVLDGSGAATVDLPSWFEALNRDFRYQLTPIGAPAPNLHVSKEVSGNRMAIAGGSSGLKVSWQVTGVRQDAFANAHRIPVEENKTGAERGKYLHPTEHGKPASAGLGAAKRAAIEKKTSEPVPARANGVGPEKQAALGKKASDPIAVRGNAVGAEKRAALDEAHGEPNGATARGIGADKKAALAKD